MKNTTSKTILVSLCTTLLVSASSLTAQVIAYEPFDTALWDADNWTVGLYSQDAAGNLGFDISADRNRKVENGNVVGFTQSQLWNSATPRFRPQLNGLSTSVVDGSGGSMRLIANVNNTAARPLASTITSDVVYASALIRLEVASGIQAYIGFTDANKSSTIGSVVGFVWNSTESRWDLRVRYNDGSAVSTPTILENASTNTTYNIVWRMDQANDTIDIWLDPPAQAIPPAPTLSVDNFGGSVSSINHLFIEGNTTDASGQGVFFDEAILAHSWNDLFEGEIFYLELQKSEDLSTWTPIQIHPDMIGPDGRLQMNKLPENQFFRMEIDTE